MKLTEKYGDFVCLRPGHTYLVNHPDYIKHILQDNHSNYCKGPRYRVLTPLLGDGLFTIDGEFWKSQRRLVQPAFNREHIAGTAANAANATEAMLERWAGAADRGQPLDIRDEMIRLTLAINLQSMLGSQGIEETERLGQAFLVMEHEMNLVEEFLPIRLPANFPTPGRLRFRRARRTVDDFINRVISERRRDGPQGSDLLSILVFARDEQTGEGINDQILHDHMLTFLNSGHETVADACTWTFYVLSQYPDVYRKLHKEVEVALGGRPPGVADLPALAYTQSAIQETMRLYPPGWGFGRTAIADDEIGGYAIPANSLVIMSPYVTHRSPAWWDSPDVFDPERFSAERSRGRPRFAYYPFGAGPRQCIGMYLAMMEVPLIIAMVTQKYRLNLVPGQRIRPKPRISLKPNREVWMTLQSASQP